IRACFDFCHSIKPGDVIFAKAGRRQLLGVGKVVGEYRFDDSRDEYHHVRAVQWINRAEVSLPEDLTLPVKTLTEIRVDHYRAGMLQLTGLSHPAPEPVSPDEPETEDDAPSRYSKSDALKDLFLGEEEFDAILLGLKERK